LGVVETLRTAATGGKSWWVALSFPVASIGWRLMKQLARQIPQAQIREGEKMIAFPGGFQQVKSADNPDSLRGEGLDLVVIDEMAHMKNWDEVWKQVLRPALSDRRGRGLFITTPKGHNHAYDLFQEAEGKKDWAAFRFPSWDNPFLDPQEIEDARQDLPDLIFRQEYGAEFVQLAGALIKREWLEIIEEAPPGRYVRGWDLAASTKTSADFTAGAKMAFIEGDLVIADLVHGRWEWPDALKTISTTARQDGPGVRQGIETVGMQRGMLDMLLREPMLAGIALSGVPVQKDKLTRFTPFIARAEQGKVKLVRGPWNKMLIDAACSFPEATHDDIPDSISLCCQMLPMVQGPLITVIGG